MKTEDDVAVHICMHAYMHTYMHTYIPTYIRTHIQREGNWTQWKKAKCPDFNRVRDSGEDAESVIQVGDKRKQTWEALDQVSDSL